MRVKCWWVMFHLVMKTLYRSDINVEGDVFPSILCYIGGNMRSLEREVYSAQGLQIKYAQRKVQIDGIVLSKTLSRHEFKLLEFLADHADKVCLREETTLAVYGEKYVPHRDNARLDALVERTRARLGDDQRNPRFIETIRGVGHRLNHYAQGMSSKWTATTDMHVMSL
jgi:DNA-binding response OmpR family regulator